MTDQPDDQPSIASVASMLSRDPTDGAAVRNAGALIESAQGSKLFTSLVEACKEQLDETSDLPRALMSICERLMDIDPGVGIYAMARLYPLAGKMHDHEVCRAIELWVHSQATLDVADALDRLATERARPSLLERYKQWASAVRRNAAERRP